MLDFNDMSKILLNTYINIKVLQIQCKDTIQ